MNGTRKNNTQSIGLAVGSTLARLWHDDRAYVQSTELILISTIAIIGLLVGLAAYRDAVVSELDDTGKAIGSLNQSYDVNIQAPTGFVDPYVSVSVLGTTVTFTGEFPLLTSTSTFANFSYADQTDACDDFAIVFPTTAIYEEGDPFP